jgi:hypothetical protein
MASRRKTPKAKKPPLSGATGPGYELDEYGDDLRWAASVSFLVGRERLARAGDSVEKMTDEGDESAT